jgi:phosphate-selective porin OprO and OprP
MDLGCRERTRALSLLLVALPGALVAPRVACAQAPAPTVVDPAVAAVDAPMVAGESEADEPARQFVRWNEYEGPFSTLRFGGGFLYDYAAYDQDDASEQQVDFTDGTKLRDFRFLLKGKFVRVQQRSLTWSAGIMWDEANERWALRQTGIMLGLPKISSELFIGRTKSGFSMNKVMVGYYGWTHERAPASDAMLPILADGIKWMGYLPKLGLGWSMGWYGDSYSDKESFSTMDHEQVARVSWLPIRKDVAHTVLHLGVSLRQGTPEDRQLRLRSRPESFQAPYVVDTGVFNAESIDMGGLEAYYRMGPLLLGSELFIQDVDSSSTGNPQFNGGEIFVAWNVTGEARPYKPAGGYFMAVSPSRPVGKGGPGAVELVLRYSNVNLDAGTLRGGKFRRITPMVNWHLSDNIRIELAYGYGELDRFDATGKTRFFTMRTQFTL